MIIALDWWWLRGGVPRQVLIAGVIPEKYAVSVGSGSSRGRYLVGQAAKWFFLISVLFSTKIGKKVFRELYSSKTGK